MVAFPALVACHICMAMALQTLETIMSFSQKDNLLHINTRGVAASAIEVTVLNSLAETVQKMKLIKGEHSISLAELKEGNYAVRLVAGNNVWVTKISIHH
jgi:hypothetical protein